MKKATVSALLEVITPCVKNNGTFKHAVSSITAVLNGIQSDEVPESFWHTKAKCSQLNFYGILKSLSTSTLLSDDINLQVLSVVQTIKLSE